MHEAQTPRIKARIIVVIMNLLVLKRIVVFAIGIVASLTIEYRIIGQYSTCQGDGSASGSAWKLFRHDKLK